MVLLVLILAIGAAIGTFVENDFGTARARELVYDNWWYELSLLLLAINMLLVIHKTKMYRVKARTMFHLSFILILIGAGLTRYYGVDGMMFIREGEKSNVIVAGEENIVTPFYLKLNDFTMTRYPGSRSPSAFSSAITVIDSQKETKFDTDIYMNHTLDYRGYKFFLT